MKLKLFKYSILLLFLAGCSNNNSSGGGGSKPADKVNSKISREGSGAMTGQTALFEVTHSMGQSKKSETNQPKVDIGNVLINNKNLLSFAVQSYSANSVNSESQKEVKSKTDLLSRSIQSGACVVNLQNENKSENTPKQFAPMKIKITGNTCPIEVSMEMQLAGIDGKNPCENQQNNMNCNFNARMRLNYRVMDERLAQQLEVKSGSMSLSFELQQIVVDGAGQIEQSMNGKSYLELKAVDLKDQLYLISGSQKINMKMVMSEPSPNNPPSSQAFGSISEELQYLHEASGTSSSLIASLTMNGNEANERYVVDGVSVTAEAYELERNKFANSMMAFGQTEEDKEKQSDNQPPPNNNTPPRPQPPVPPHDDTTEPPPAPNPVTPPNPPSPPTPPSPEPKDSRWVCVVKDLRTDNVHIGYGAVEFIAKSKATQACQNSSDSCSGSPTCEEQTESNPSAWYCEAKSYGGKVYSGSGRSQTEASFAARKECINKNSKKPSECRTVYASDCVHVPTRY